MVDERCALLSGEVTEQAFRAQANLDADRALRLVLASLKDDSDSRQAIFEEEIAGCPNCYRGVVAVMAGMYAGELDSSDDGGTDEAIRRVEWMISRGIELRLEDGE